MARIWWIDEGRLAGSPNPTGAELEELRECGFATIISLLQGAEQQPRYQRIEIEHTGYEWHSIPVWDNTAPTIGQIRHFLSLVNDHLPRGAILVHCQGGVGRTGTMAAAYWMSQGLGPEEAVARVRKSCPTAVENSAQRRVLDELEPVLRSSRGPIVS